MRQNNGSDWIFIFGSPFNCLDPKHTEKQTENDVMTGGEAGG